MRQNEIKWSPNVLFILLALQKLGHHFDKTELSQFIPNYD